ncbi:MAG: glycosyltransferase [Anaerolineales bacterium]
MAHKISVVLTSYNHAKYLRQAIESVLAQTYADFEFIIWDDASTDDSWQIIQSYSDPRIRASRNETAKRGWSFRKAVLEVREGEYIAIHHSDDVWEPRKLEKQMAFLEENPAVGAVFTHVSVIGEDGEEFDDPSHFYYKIFDQPNRSRQEWLNYFFFHGNALCHPSVLMRRNCFTACGGYRLGFTQVGDLDMWVRMCLKYDIHILPEKLFRFRVRADNMNLSSDRPETRIRSNFENLLIYQNYRGIQSVQEFIKIFPEAEEYNSPDGFDAGYALGMLALHAREIPATKLFGLTLLFEALNNPERAGRIEQLYGFNHSDFVTLTARNDIFSIELVQTLSFQLAEIQSSNVSLAGQVQELNFQLAEIQKSKAWKMAMFLRQIRLAIMPPGSRRARWLSGLMRAIGKS